MKLKFNILFANRTRVKIYKGFLHLQICSGYLENYLFFISVIG